jgi:uncharacterized protein (TIGR01244 family)
MDDAVRAIYNLREADEALITSGQPTEAQLSALARQGIRLVVNLAPHDAPSALTDEAGLVASLGMDYVHIPVTFSAPADADLEMFFAAMDARRSTPTLVHCAANKRVSAFLGLYRTLKLGWSEDDAFALMRTVWEPDAVWARFIASALARHRS